MWRWVFLAALVSLVAPLPGCGRRGAEVTDLEGKPFDPLAASASANRATVLVFVGTTCPISNRYAPELARLHARFAPQGIAFHLVYPLASELAPQVRAHVH